MNTTSTLQDAQLPCPLPPARASVQAFDEALYAVARAEGFRISLTDHRGRRFVHRFYVDNTPAVRKFGVWAYSASGAANLVAWTAGAGRGPSGNRVRNGWGNPRNAQRIADLLNEAANTWCAQHGPVPKPAKRPKKKHK